MTEETTNSTNDVASSDTATENNSTNVLGTDLTNVAKSLGIDPVLLDNFMKVYVPLIEQVTEHVTTTVHDVATDVPVFVVDSVDQLLNDVDNELEKLKSETIFTLIDDVKKKIEELIHRHVKDNSTETKTSNIKIS